MKTKSSLPIPEVEVHPQTEIALTVPNDLGVLNRLFAALAPHRDAILVHHFYTSADHAVVMAVSPKPGPIARGLHAAGFKFQRRPVLVVTQSRYGVSSVQLSGALRAGGVQPLDVYTRPVPPAGYLTVLRVDNGENEAAVSSLMNLLRPPPESRAHSTEVSHDENLLAMLAGIDDRH